MVCSCARGFRRVFEDDFDLISLLGYAMLEVD